MSETTERARLSFNIEDDDENDVIARKAEEISEKTGFTAGATKRKKDHEISSKKTDESIKRKPRRRPKTGRTYPFNTKIKPEIYDKICALSDGASDQEGRVVSMAEIIERAIELLEKQSNK